MYSYVLILKHTILVTTNTIVQVSEYWENNVIQENFLGLLFKLFLA